MKIRITGDDRHLAQIRQICEDIGAEVVGEEVEPKECNLWLHHLCCYTCALESMFRAMRGYADCLVYVVTTDDKTLETKKFLPWVTHITSKADLLNLITK